MNLFNLSRLKFDLGLLHVHQNCVNKTKYNFTARLGADDACS